MKKIRKILILILIFVITIFICLNGCGKVKEDTSSEVKEIQQINHTRQAREVNQEIYSNDIQKRLLEEVESKKKLKEYTIDDPLYLINPFKTNTTSLYIYFETKEPSMVKYNVHVDDEKISDFSRTLYNDGEKNLTTYHEYSLIGLIGGMKNIITINLYNSKNELMTSKVIDVDAPELASNADIILKKEKGSSINPLSDGLFVTLGHINSGEDKSYIYDNDGVARGEINLDSYRIDRILFRNNLMYISTGTNKISAINRIGYAEKTYDLGKYELHHDYVFGEGDSLIVLANNTELNSTEDIIIKLDLKTGSVTELLDLGDLFSEIKKKAVVSTQDNKTSLDWIHVNSISFINDTDVILSSRETSTIIKIKNIYNKPEIAYLIGPEIVWKGTSYLDYLLTKKGEFVINGGQHNVEVVHDTSLKENQYYLDLFDNNLGYSGSNPSIDWSKIEGINGDKSMYYRYLIDENNNTFMLVDSLNVTKSDYISNIEHYDGHLIVDSGNAFLFAEYDENKELIASFTLEQEIWGLYRCYKESFDDFYFYQNQYFNS